MKSGRRNVVVGLFVLCGFVGLGLLALLFGKQPTWLAGGNTYPIEIQFHHAGGMRAGNVVTVNGIEVGRVTEISLYDPEHLDAEYNVRVTVAMRKQFQIPDGSTAVTTEPVLGQGRPNIQIEPGLSSNPPLVSGARIPGRVLGAVESIFPSHIISTFTNTAEQIRTTGQALTPVLDDLHELLDRRSPREVDIAGKQGNLSSAMARFDQIMRDLTGYIGDTNTQQEFRLSMANIYQMTEHGKLAAEDIRLAAVEARQFVGEARRTVATAEKTMQSVDSRMSEVTTRLSGSFGKADQFLDSLLQITTPIARGEGTLGRMLRDNELYEAVVLTMRRLSAMIAEYQALAKEWQKGKVRVAF